MYPHTEDVQDEPLFVNRQAAAQGFDTAYEFINCNMGGRAGDYFADAAGRSIPHRVFALPWGRVETYRLCARDYYVCKHCTDWRSVLDAAHSQPKAYAFAVRRGSSHLVECNGTDSLYMIRKSFLIHCLFNFNPIIILNKTS